MLHLVWLVCVTAWYAGQEGNAVPSWPAYQAVTQTNHTRWSINTIRSPDDEHLMLETCTEMKWINKYIKMFIKLVISKNLWRDAGWTNYKNFQVFILDCFMVQCPFWDSNHENVLCCSFLLVLCTLPVATRDENRFGEDWDQIMGESIWTREIWNSTTIQEIPARNENLHLLFLA